MPSFKDMQKRYKNAGSVGQQIKEMSDNVMQQTWDNAISTRLCYIYDYYHDDQCDTNNCYGYDPSLSKTKFPVSLKFIIKEYKSAAKDDPEYHIQFTPDDWNSQRCVPDWFNSYLKLGITFPIGLFVDIPDDRGVYWKWLVFYTEPANQFPKFGVIKCNYYFRWIIDDGVHKYQRGIWGAERTQNSYTSGTWLGDKFNVLDEQGKFWVPWNQITFELRHDQRLFISMLQPQPYVYKISKIKNTAPKGIIAVTVEQDEFNQFTDYVNLDTGEMYADYYKSQVEPDISTDPTEPDIPTDFSLNLSTSSYDIGIGAVKHIIALLTDKNGEEIKDEKYVVQFKWHIYLDDVDITSDSNMIVDFNQDNNDLLFTFVDNDDYVGSIITVTCDCIVNNASEKVSELSKTMKFNIVY